MPPEALYFLVGKPAAQLGPRRLEACFAVIEIGRDTIAAGGLYGALCVMVQNQFGFAKIILSLYRRLDEASRFFAQGRVNFAGTDT